MDNNMYRNYNSTDGTNTSSSNNAGNANQTDHMESINQMNNTDNTNEVNSMDNTNGMNSTDNTNEVDSMGNTNGMNNTGNTNEVNSMGNTNQADHMDGGQQEESAGNLTNIDRNTDSGQHESSSTYGYSYINQEHKNPNNIWRAEDNTEKTYHNYAHANESSNYSNAQSGADSTYGGAQTGGVYGSAQTGTGGAYGNAQTGTGGAYGNAQTGTGGAYSNAQSGTGSAYNNAYTNAQSGMESNGYANEQSDANNAYGGAQSGANYNYSNIYGSANRQGNWNTYTDAKKQKREERAKKRAAKNSGKGQNFGFKLAKCASIALVFGLVAGTAFEGSSYLVGGLLGTDKGEVVSEEKEDKEDKGVLNKPDKTQQTALPSSTASAGLADVASIAEECMPSIVAITNMSEVQYQNWFGQTQNYEIPSAGSGILVSEDDEYLYIATNNHVVTGATTLTVQFCDGVTASAEVKGTDKSVDLAVVKVKKADVEAETLSEVKIATLGNSDEVKVGSQAIAIGNALGYGQSVTTGIISALEREVTMEDENTGETFTNDLIQTDAAINPGNSGGALLNSRGEVIGINSSKYSDTTVEGMGFAIPSNMAAPIIDDLITREAVSEDKAAFLGIVGVDVNSSVAETYNLPEGVCITELSRGTAAEKYGLKKGDIITKFDGKTVKSMESLSTMITYYEAGAEVKITIQRASEGGYQEQVVKVVLGKKNS